MRWTAVLAVSLGACVAYVPVGIPSRASWGRTEGLQTEPAALWTLPPDTGYAVYTARPVATAGVESPNTERHALHMAISASASFFPRNRDAHAAHHHLLRGMLLAESGFSATDHFKSAFESVTNPEDKKMEGSARTLDKFMISEKVSVSGKVPLLSSITVSQSGAVVFRRPQVPLNDQNKEGTESKTSQKTSGRAMDETLLVIQTTQKSQREQGVRQETILQNEKVTMLEKTNERVLYPWGSLQVGRTATGINPPEKVTAPFNTVKSDKNATLNHSWLQSNWESFDYNGEIQQNGTERKGAASSVMTLKLSTKDYSNSEVPPLNLSKFKASDQKSDFFAHLKNDKQRVVSALNQIGFQTEEYSSESETDFLNHTFGELRTEKVNVPISVSKNLNSSKAQFNPNRQPANGASDIFSEFAVMTKSPHSQIGIKMSELFLWNESRPQVNGNDNKMDRSQQNWTHDSVTSPSSISLPAIFENDNSDVPHRNESSHYVKSNGSKNLNESEFYRSQDLQYHAKESTGFPFTIRRENIPERPHLNLNRREENESVTESSGLLETKSFDQIVTSIVTRNRQESHQEEFDSTTHHASSDIHNQSTSNTFIFTSTPLSVKCTERSYVESSPPCKTSPQLLTAFGDTILDSGNTNRFTVIPATVTQVARTSSIGRSDANGITSSWFDGLQRTQKITGDLSTMSNNAQEYVSTLNSRNGEPLEIYKHPNFHSSSVERSIFQDDVLTTNKIREGRRMADQTTWPVSNNLWRRVTALGDISNSPVTIYQHGTSESSLVELAISDITGTTASTQRTESLKKERTTEFMTEDVVGDVLVVHSGADETLNISLTSEHNVSDQAHESNIVDQISTTEKTSSTSQKPRDHPEAMSPIKERKGVFEENSVIDEFVKPSLKPPSVRKTTPATPWADTIFAITDVGSSERFTKKYNSHVEDFSNFKIRTRRVQADVTIGSPRNFRGTAPSKTRKENVQASTISRHSSSTYSLSEQQPTSSAESFKSKVRTSPSFLGTATNTDQETIGTVKGVTGGNGLTDRTDTIPLELTDRAVNGNPDQTSHQPFGIFTKQRLSEKAYFNDMATSTRQQLHADSDDSLVRYTDWISMSSEITKENIQSSTLRNYFRTGSALYNEPPKIPSYTFESKESIISSLIDTPFKFHDSKTTEIASGGPRLNRLTTLRSTELFNSATLTTQPEDTTESFRKLENVLALTSEIRTENLPSIQSISPTLRSIHNDMPQRRATDPLESTVPSLVVNAFKTLSILAPEWSKAVTEHTTPATEYTTPTGKFTDTLTKITVRKKPKSATASSLVVSEDLQPHRKAIVITFQKPKSVSSKVFERNSTKIYEPTTQVNLEMYPSTSKASRSSASSIQYQEAAKMKIVLPLAETSLRSENTSLTPLLNTKGEDGASQYYITSSEIQTLVTSTHRSSPEINSPGSNLLPSVLSTSNTDKQFTSKFLPILSQNAENGSLGITPLPKWSILNNATQERSTIEGDVSFNTTVMSVSVTQSGEKYIGTPEMPAENEEVFIETESGTSWGLLQSTYSDSTESSADPWLQYQTQPSTDSEVLQRRLDTSSHKLRFVLQSTTETSTKSRNRQHKHRATGKRKMKTSPMIQAMSNERKRFSNGSRVVIYDETGDCTPDVVDAISNLGDVIKSKVIIEMICKPQKSQRPGFREKHANNSQKSGTYRTLRSLHRSETERHLRAARIRTSLLKQIKLAPQVAADIKSSKFTKKEHRKHRKNTNHVLVRTESRQNQTLSTKAYQAEHVGITGPLRDTLWRDDSPPHAKHVGSPQKGYSKDLVSILRTGSSHKNPSHIRLTKTSSFVSGDNLIARGDSVTTRLHGVKEEVEGRMGLERRLRVTKTSGNRWPGPGNAHDQVQIPLEKRAVSRRCSSLNDTMDNSTEQQGFDNFAHKKERRSSDTEKDCGQSCKLNQILHNEEFGPTKPTVMNMNKSEQHSGSRATTPDDTTVSMFFGRMNVEDLTNLNAVNLTGKSRYDTDETNPLTKTKRTTAVFDEGTEKRQGSSSHHEVQQNSEFIPDKVTVTASLVRSHPSGAPIPPSGEVPSVTPSFEAYVPVNNNRSTTAAVKGDDIQRSSSSDRSFPEGILTTATRRSFSRDKASESKIDRTMQKDYVQGQIQVLKQLQPASIEPKLVTNAVKLFGKQNSDKSPTTQAGYSISRQLNLMAITNSYINPLRKAIVINFHKVRPMSLNSTQNELLRRTPSPDMNTDRVFIRSRNSAATVNSPFPAVSALRSGPFAPLEKTESKRAPASEEEEKFRVAHANIVKAAQKVPTSGRMDEVTPQSLSLRLQPPPSNEKINQNELGRINYTSITSSTERGEEVAQTVIIYDDTWDCSPEVMDTIPTLKDRKSSGSEKVVIEMICNSEGQNSTMIEDDPEKPSTPIIKRRVREAVLKNQRVASPGKGDDRALASITPTATSVKKKNHPSKQYTGGKYSELWRVLHSTTPKESPKQSVKKLNISQKSNAMMKDLKYPIPVTFPNGQPKKIISLDSILIILGNNITEINKQRKLSSNQGKAKDQERTDSNFSEIGRLLKFLSQFSLDFAEKHSDYGTNDTARRSIVDAKGAHANEKTILGKEREPQLKTKEECAALCRPKHRPVCATVGSRKRTFSSLCHVKIEGCITGKGTKILYVGSCKEEAKENTKQGKVKPELLPTF